MKKILFSLIVIFSFASANAQDNTDVILWIGPAITKKIDDNFSAKYWGVVRFNQDVSTYQNNFSELFLNYKLNDIHAFGLGYRLTFLELDEPLPDAHWIMLDYKINAPVSDALVLKNRFRYQLALDAKDIEAADFLRNILFLVPKTKFKIKPFVGIEPWFQLNDRNEINRLRYEFGFNYKILENFNLMMKYSKEDIIALDPVPTNHIIFTVLTYNIPKKAKE